MLTFAQFLTDAVERGPIPGMRSDAIDLACVAFAIEAHRGVGDARARAKAGTAWRRNRAKDALGFGAIAPPGPLRVYWLSS
jgi:hypothetical protein